MACEITWSNRKWYVKDGGPQGPGPNYWSHKNVTVDRLGALRLRIRCLNGIWQCAEVWTKEAMPRGVYQFWVRRHLDKLASNVVLGLFNYGTEDGVNEIDIEFCRTLTGDGKLGHYGVWPKEEGGPHVERSFDFTMPGSARSTHRFCWLRKCVGFQSLFGWPDGSGVTIANWATPGQFAPYVPVGPLPLHINLWLKNGGRPRDGKSVSVVIRRLDFIALDL